MRLLRCVLVAVLAAMPMASAQDDAPLTAAAAAARFAACQGRLDAAEGLHDLAALARDARRALDPAPDAPALRRFVIDTMLPALRARFTRRQGLGHGVAQQAVAALWVGLREPAATTDVLVALGHDLPRGRELLPLCGDIAALPLDAPQDDLFFAAVRDALRRNPRDVDRLIPAIERRPGERWLRLLTDSALPAVAPLQPDGPVLARSIVRSLGAFWDGPPHLRHRVPALLKLLAVRDAELQRAALEGLDRLTFQRIGNPKRFRAVWNAFERRMAGADDAALAIGLLRDRLADARAAGDEAGLAADLAARVTALGRPGSTWATPVLLEVFAWKGGALAPARGAAIVALRRTGDPGAVAPLVALVADALADARAEADAIAAIGALAGEPTDSVETILRRSLREGRPLPRRDHPPSRERIMPGVTANGRGFDLSPGSTVADFIRSRGLDPRYVIVERNGEALERARYEEVMSFERQLIDDGTILVKLFFLIDEKTDITSFRKEIRWNDVYYRLAGGI